MAAGARLRAAHGCGQGPMARRLHCDVVGGARPSVLREDSPACITVGIQVRQLLLFRGNLASESFHDARCHVVIRRECQTLLPANRDCRYTSINVSATPAPTLGCSPWPLRLA